MIDIKYTLTITHNNIMYIPSVLDGVKWETERKGTQGKLSFSMLLDENIVFEEGDRVLFKVGDKAVFSGFIFSLKNSKENTVSVTAYDQIRYLKNKHTYKFEDLYLNDVILQIAEDFKLQVGTLQSTNFKIDSIIYDNQPLIDIIQNLIDLHLACTNQLYVFYDDVGKLTLKNLSSMKTTVLIDDSSCEDYDFQTSIDNNVYNQVVIYYNNKETSTRELYIAKDSNNINQWGVLQFLEEAKEQGNAKNKADKLLELYNTKAKSLTIKNAIGHPEVRAGSLVMISLKVRNETINNYMLVEKCTHNFEENHHTMNLTLKGGTFYA